MRRILKSIVFVFVGCSCLCAALKLESQAQTLVEQHRKIRQAIDQRDYATAQRELQSLQTIDKRRFEINNYDYLLARAAEKAGDRAIAIANYQAVVKRNSVLREYALWHLSQIARGSDNLLLERIFLQQLRVVAAPEHLLAQPTARRLAASFYESGDYAATVQILKTAAENPTAKTASLADKNKSKSEDRERLALLADALLRAGSKQEAREIFARLINSSPNFAAPDDYALAAARGLDELDDFKSVNTVQTIALPDYEHQRRAQIYQFNRDFAGARAHFQFIVNNLTASPLRPDALLQIGRIAVQEEKYVEAAAIFQRVQAEFPQHPAARDAALFTAGAYARVGNYDEAVANYKSFITKYIENAPDENDLPENPERAFLNLIDVLRDRGRDHEALDWIRKTRERFKNQLPEAQAVFSEARVYLSQNDFEKALRSFEELRDFPDLGGARVSGGTNAPEVDFLRAFCLEQLGRAGEAANVYLSIADGRAEYYGSRATARLRELTANKAARDALRVRFELFRSAAQQDFAAKNLERARQNLQNALRLAADANEQRELLEKLRVVYQSLPAYKSAPRAEILQLGRQKPLENANAKIGADAVSGESRIADELIFLGLYDEAAPELEKSKILNSKTDAADANKFALAVIYKRGDLANRAIAFAEPLWRAVPADYQIELAPRESLELLYPAPYAEILRSRAAAPRNVDARFLLAIMRQESRFQASVKSSAAARGLMQFITATANRIAAELDRTDFVANDLYNPETAILFGAQYVSNLFRQFPAEPEAVAAAYNGGESNVTRWLVRARSTDADRYVAEFQFAQSKDYVYKVMSNFAVYQKLYDQNLQPK